MHFLMPWLDIKVATKEMTNLRNVYWRCVGVHSCDDERPMARGREVATECEVWRFRHLCNTILLVCTLSGKSRPGTGYKGKEVSYDLA